MAYHVVTRIALVCLLVLSLTSCRQEESTCYCCNVVTCEGGRKATKDCDDPNELCTSKQECDSACGRSGILDSIRDEAGFQIKMATVKAHRYVLASMNSDPPTCEEACADPDNPYCFTVEAGSANRSLLSAIDDLRRRVMTEKSSIAKSDVMRSFDITEDPCNRSDTTIVSAGGSEYVVNSGSECTWTTTLPFVDQSKPINLSVELPGELKGKRKTTRSSLTVTFDDAKKRPFLKFSRSGLQSDWGGDVLKVKSIGSSVVISTENGCIGLKLKSGNSRQRT